MKAEDSDRAALTILVETGDIEPCVTAFHRLLYALAHCYPFADPDEAVYLALLDIRQWCAASSGSVLPARVWVLGLAKQRFEQLLREGG